MNMSTRCHYRHRIAKGLFDHDCNGRVVRKKITRYIPVLWQSVIVIRQTRALAYANCVNISFGCRFFLFLSVYEIGEGVPNGTHQIYKRTRAKAYMFFRRIRQQCFRLNASELKRFNPSEICVHSLFPQREKTFSDLGCTL